VTASRQEANDDENEVSANDGPPSPSTLRQQSLRNDATGFDSAALGPFCFARISTGGAAKTLAAQKKLALAAAAAGAYWAVTNKMALQKKRMAPAAQHSGPP
jgi:hypothetical protein